MFVQKKIYSTLSYRACCTRYMILVVALVLSVTIFSCSIDINAVLERVPMSGAPSIVGERNIDQNNVHSDDAQIAYTEFAVYDSEHEITHTLAARMRVHVRVARFFVQYLQDLLAIDGIHELVEILELEQYIANAYGVQKVDIRTHSDLAYSATRGSTDDKDNNATTNIDIEVYPLAISRWDTIIIDFDTGDLLQSMHTLNIPYTIHETPHNTSVLHDGAQYEWRITISRSFISALFGQLSQGGGIDISALFLPDQDSVGIHAFPEHIAWAFSEYIPQADAEHLVTHSSLETTVNKTWVTQDNHTPDPGWTLSQGEYISDDSLFRSMPNASAQHQTDLLVPILYSMSEHMILRY